MNVDKEITAERLRSQGNVFLGTGIANLVPNIIIIFLLILSIYHSVSDLREWVDEAPEEDRSIFDSTDDLYVTGIQITLFFSIIVLVLLIIPLFSFIWMTFCGYRMRYKTHEYRKYASLLIPIIIILIGVVFYPIITIYSGILLIESELYPIIWGFFMIFVIKLISIIVILWKKPVLTYPKGALTQSD